MPNAPIRPTAATAPRRPPRNLRFYVLGALLIATIGPLVLLSAVNVYYSATRREQEADQKLASTARRVAAAIDDHIDKHAKAIESFAAVYPDLDRNDALDALIREHAIFNGFTALMMADTQGRVLAASPSAGQPTSVADWQCFSEPLRTGRTFVSGAFQGDGPGKQPRVGIGTPLRDSSGRITGVIRGSLNLDKVERITREYRASGQTVLVLDPRAPDESTRGRVFRDGKEYLAASARNAAGWCVVAMLPMGQIRLEMYRILLTAGFWLAVGIAGCVLLARTVASRVTRPLHGLLAHVRDLTPVDSRDFANAPAEILELVASFARMSARLAESKRQLEERVRERTAELEAEVADRVRAQETLILRDRAMAAATEGIAITDCSLPDNPLIYVNSGFERITGYSAAEVLGGNCRILQGPGSDPAAVQQLREAIRERRPGSVVILNYRKDGTPFWNRVSITPIFNDAGEVTHFVGIQSDITHQKEIERLKTELVSTVSHELRTPLTSLQGFTELLLARDYPAEQRRRFLNIVHSEATRLTRLIDDMLDLQRIEAGQERYQMKLVNPAPLVREVVDVFTAAYPTHQFVMEIADPLPGVSVDNDRIRQVLTNLIANAVKFSPGGGAVTIGVSAADDTVVFRVADEGMGIPAEAIPKLFTRFFRVDNTETRRIGGTGLGLELVKRIVESHGGRVWVESEVGRGSQFHFALPQVDRSIVAADAPRP